MEKELRIKEIENEIKRKVNQYVNAQKRYHGDNTLSNRLEGEIDTLEIQLKLLREE